MQTKLSRVYQDLHSRSMKHITHYHQDLNKWDYLAIADNPDRPFLHFTRPTGTTIICFYEAEWYPVGQVPYLFGHADKNKILRDKMLTLEYVWKNYDTKEALYFDGNKFKKVDKGQSVEILENYTRSIKSQWRREKNER